MPFLRWAGGKQWLVPHVLGLIPEVHGTYFEPFLGGGSLFFRLQPTKAVLGDLNPRLIDTYTAVRDQPVAVLRWLDRWRNSRQSYSRIRSAVFPGRFQRAAQFIYLNKTCWNGLYRVNRSGQFNVPYCGDPSRSTHDKAKILAAAKALAPATILCCDFEDLLSSTSASDLVYLDPPYISRHSDNGFRRYNERLFTWDDQRRLASVAHRLSRSGCFVVVSNASAPSILPLFRGFDRTLLSRKSLLAADASARAPATEVVLTTRNLRRRP